MNTTRNFLRNLSIRYKLMAVNFVTTGSALLVAAAFLIAMEFFSFRHQLLEDTRVQATVIGENSGAALMFRDARAADEILRALSASPDVMQAALFGHDGDLLAAYRRHGARAHTWPERVGEGYTLTREQIDIFQPVTVKGERVGTVYLTTSLGRLYTRMIWYSMLMAGAALVALLAAFLILSRLQHNITGPLSRLVGLMHDVSETRDYTQRADVASRDEIGALATGFNAMLTQIETRDHELNQELMERRRAEKRLDHLAHYDTVTRLPNRNFFNDKLKLAITQALGSGRRAALMYIDLDNFKIVNDTLGHQIGDRLLNSVGKRLATCLRGGDTICRIGGDEFAVILEGLGSREDASLVAQKLQETLASVFVIDEHDIFVSASIGISICPDDDAEGDNLLRHADAAMYYAKERGKNNFQYFQPEMKGKVLKRLTMETHLRRAIERNELMLYYQPIYDLQAQRIAGVEALLRWQHPELGMVNPAEFIPVAEETGLIVPIGIWVLRTACRQWMDWKSTVGEIPVAVNISGRQFQDDKLVDIVLDVVAETGMAAEQLTIELTESTLMDNSEAMITRLAQFKEAGIKLSIDDFGTGYSSMSYLKRFPISTLKIDRSFVRDIPGDADDVAITRMIIAMGESLQMKIVAEGVETAEQVNFLQAFPSVVAQGYYFSRPVPPEAIVAMKQEEMARTNSGAASGRAKPAPRDEA